MKWHSQQQPAGFDEVDNYLATPGCMDKGQYSGGDFKVEENCQNFSLVFMLLKPSKQGSGKRSKVSVW